MKEKAKLNKHMINKALKLACLTAALSTSAHAATTVFSNDFEDGNLAAEIGTSTLSSNTALTASVVGTSAAASGLGDNVGLYDTNTIDQLDMTWTLSSTVSLRGGNTVSLSFNTAFRRISGAAKTIYIDALDSAGDIVARVVLGDSGTYATNTSARQRPGYATLSGGDLVLPAGTGTTPGNYWWGSDATPADFDVAKDAQFTITYGATGFDISTTNQGAGTSTYSTSSSLSTYDGSTFADIASFALTNKTLTGYGVYLDNIQVVGEVVPEPSSTALLGLGVLALILRRRKA